METAVELNLRPGAKVTKRKANHGACSSCRQAKSRCDGTNDLSQACSRCTRLNHACERDSGYQRIPKKAKIDELAQQVRQLQSVLDSNNVRSSPPIEAPLLDTTAASQQPPMLASPRMVASESIYQGSMPNQTVTSPYQVSSGSHSQSKSNHFLSGANAEEINANYRTDVLTPVSQGMVDSMLSAALPYNSFAQTDSYVQPRSIGCISLTSDQIRSIFNIYFQYYHPFFSILDPSVSPDDYYARCPLLYWKIASIASQRYEEEPTLLGMLSQPVQDLLWSTMRKLPHTPFVVEAIILSSMWPFPTSSMWIDPSTMLISMAKSSVMQLGLHRPEHIQDFSRVERQLSIKGIQDSIRIWASCYIAAQCNTSSNGQESILREDQSITRACEQHNPYQLPVRLHQHLRLMKFSVLAGKLLSENIDTPSGLPHAQDRVNILERLELEFQELKVQIEVNTTNITQLYINCTQLQMRVFYFFEGINPEIRKVGLRKCFVSASNMIETIVLAESQNSIIFAPHFLCRMLFVAGIVLMRILNSSYSDMVDFQAGKKNFNSSIRLIRQCSLQDNDNQGRASKILSQLWNHYQKSAIIRENPPTLQVKSRSGASVMHDSLWIWRQKCDDQKNSRRGTRQNSPGKSPRQQLTNPSMTNSVYNNDSNIEMNDILNFGGIDDLDTSWLGEANLLSWILPSLDQIPQMSNSTI